MILYAFRCAVCRRPLDVLRDVGDTAPPEHCGQPAQRVYQVSKPITRPQGYNLRPEDKGYWDFGEFNHPGVPPLRESVGVADAYFAAERDIASAADDHGDEPA